MVKIDHTGMRHGRLVVISQGNRPSGKAHGAYWVCRCDCGGEVVTNGNSLRRGHVRSCGCLRTETSRQRRPREHVVGKRYGRLVVLEDNSVGADRRWLCQCDCGTVKSILSGAIKSGDTRSCGCLRNEASAKRNAKPQGTSGLNAMYIACRQSASSRSIKFFLSKEEFAGIISQRCYWCGVAPRPRGSHRAVGKFTCTDIDRVDNTAGYIVSNCVACCKQCNVAKNNYTVEDFLEWAKRLIEHQKGKELSGRPQK